MFSSFFFLNLYSVCCGLVPSGAHLQHNNRETIRWMWMWMDCLSDSAEPQRWGTKLRAAEMMEENKKWTSGFGDPAACSKLFNHFSCWTFVLYCKSNGEAVFHLVETLGSGRLFFIFYENGVEEIREGWRGREVRGRAEGCDGWEGEMRGDQKTLECLRVPLKAATATENVVTLLQECVCVTYRAEHHGKETEQTHSITSLTFSTFLSTAHFDYCASSIMKYHLWESKVISKKFEHSSNKNTYVFIWICSVWKESHNFPQSIFSHFTIWNPVNWWHLLRSCV